MFELRTKFQVSRRNRSEDVAILRICFGLDVQTNELTNPKPKVLCPGQSKVNQYIFGIFSL